MDKNINDFDIIKKKNEFELSKLYLYTAKILFTYLVNWIIFKHNIKDIKHISKFNF